MANETQTVEATKRFALTEANSSRMTTYLKNILTSGEGNPMAKLDSFVRSSSVLTPAFSKALGQAKLPTVEVADLEAAIKARDEAITKINTEADAASKEIDAQLEALTKKRDEVRKPFSERAEIEAKAREAVSGQMTERLNPVREAIDKLKGELVTLAASALVGKGKVLGEPKNEEEAKAAQALAAEFADVLLTIDRPSTPGSAPSASTTSTGGGGRGRAGASKVRISKGSDNREFASLNAARAFVYQQANGKAPDYQANAGACEKYLANQGWKVEHLA